MNKYTFTCKFCGKIFQDFRYHKKRQYCTCSCRAKALMGKIWADLDPDVRQRRLEASRIGFKRRWQDPAFRKRMSELQRKHYAEHPERRRRQSAARLKAYESPEAREKTSKATKRLWKETAFPRKALQSLHKHPNLTEKRLQLILEALFPNEYKYVGGGDVVIDGLNPDFINANGQKKIIELFGIYWHLPDEIPLRAARFAKYGYSMHVVWDTELGNIEDLRSKLLAFHNEHSDFIKKRI